MSSVISGPTAVVLSGGGARGAYQIGVLRGIFEITRSLGIVQPFQILTGVSAGAINAAYLAASADNYAKAIDELQHFWGNIRSEQVYRTDTWSLGKIGIRWAWDAVSGGYRLGEQARALLDTAPLASLLGDHIPFDRIAKLLRDRILAGVAVSATNYASSESISFFMSEPPVPAWRRSRRIGLAQNLSVAEVMASAAIPILFPPVKIGTAFFGDGCLRNTAPLSPALHLGAERLIIIGVRKAATDHRAHDSQAKILDSYETSPSLARILNVLINAVLLDGVDADIERLSRINRTVALLTPPASEQTPLRRIPWLYLHPSKDISAIAMQEAWSMPRMIRYLIAGLGTDVEAADLISYLLFEPTFCQRLITLGYTDAISAREQLIEFFTSEPRVSDAE